MKKLMMIVALVAATVSANAQNINREVGAFTLQPKVGLALGSFSGDYIKPVGSDAKPKTRVGFIAGVEGEYYIADWFGAALGLNYAQQGWKFEDTKTKLDYLNVPIVANFYVARGLALKTGAQFGFLLNSKVDGVDRKDDCKKMNFSIPIGISYEISNIVLDIRYNIALTKVNKYDDPNNEKSRSDMVQFTLGYKFEL
jgi:opacity protein-like surface antigen